MFSSDNSRYLVSARSLVSEKGNGPLDLPELYCESKVVLT